ncbi:lipopolysaccharide biosynthesis protein [Kangiella sp.]|uniref:lipopolysaccharide biosynthesis protein n=1 Tax=Kangiella sp. TaxID=1920245 RepID=UPI0019C1A1E8|nr:oligosaccharide flippase family protein [Kangiella sp.]MBD3652399.1 oligosaccharide flippase family protein [Kangiella sp.]
MKLRNIISLTGGTVVAQILPFVVLPFLTLGLGQESFGRFSLFFVSTMMLGSISSLRYEYAINASKNKQESWLLTVLTIDLNLIFFVVLGLIVTTLIYFEVLSPEWLLLPFSVLLFSINQGLQSYVNYHSMFKHMAIARIINSGICSILQLVIVYFLSIDIGAYLGMIIGFVFANIYICIIAPKKISLFLNKKVLFIQKKYSEYPKYIFPGTAINYFSSNMPIYFLSIFYGNVYAGYYSLAIRIAGAPTVIIGRSIGEVFRVTALKDYLEKGSFREVFLKTISYSFIIGLVGFVFLFLFSDLLISLYLGAEWLNVSSYIKILLPMFILQFSLAPITYTMMITGAQHKDFVWQVFRLLLVSMSLLAAYLIYDNDISITIASMISLSASFLVYYLIAYNEASGK